ncbi:MAG: DUF3754 domain-containing protein [Campylobacterota bacterium]|nr:DUF3754 domain-containing protein [Campylobacterota bacterium]
MSITFNNQIEERFIPVAYDELFEGCLKYFNIQEKEHYQNFSSLLRSFYHARFHKELLALKALYLPFNPDADTISLQSYTHKEYEKIKSNLVSKVRPLLNDANYEELTQDALSRALNDISPYGVDVSVDFDDFEDIVLFFRGEANREEQRRTLKSLYLKKETLHVKVYRRLFLLIKPKTLDTRAQEIVDKEGGNIEKVRKKLRRTTPVLIDGDASERIYLKLFKDIPQADLEMLFPNTKVKITLQDKMKIGLTGGGGTAGGAFTLISKLSAAIDPISLLIALGGFGGVLWRQIKNVFTHQTRYMAALAKNLYFYNLDNNAGVLTYMIDMAEAEESKEALLAYLFLNTSTAVLNRESLDKKIEAYMLETYKIPMDFEVDDGIEKLLELGIVKESNGILEVITRDEALRCLKSEMQKLYAT